MNNLLTKLTYALLFISATSCTRMIGYWSLENGYADQSGCAPILMPADIPAELYTHMIFAFIPINSDQTISDPDNTTTQQFSEIQAMKLRNPDLKVMVSFGGWAMNMSLYSTAVSTASGRSNLIQNVMTYLRKWNWDGADFDWEYPADPTRGGTPQDPANFVLFIQELRQAVNSETIPSGKSRLLLSIPLPGGEWHGQYYIMKSIIQNLDFANIMAYNLHGPWETNAYCSANFYDGTPANYPYHGYSISDAVEYFLNQDGTLPAYKFNLGVTFAGVAFTLASSSNTSMGAPTIGAGNGGVCTKEAGYMAYFEVETLINNGVVSSVAFDPIGYCKYFTYNTTQWIGYDDASTLAQKVALVEKIGLGGVSIWAMYAESATGPVLQTSIAKALFPSGQPTTADFDGTNINNTEDQNSSSSKQMYSLTLFMFMTMVFLTNL